MNRIIIVISALAILATGMQATAPELDNASLCMYASFWLPRPVQANVFSLNFQSISKPTTPSGSQAPDFEYYFNKVPTQTPPPTINPRDKEICWGRRLAWPYFQTLNSGDIACFGFKYESSGGILPLPAVWSYSTNPVGCAPFPMPLWDKEIDNLLSWITVSNTKYCCPCIQGNPEKLLGSLEISCSWATSNQVIPLAELTWGSSTLNNLTWSSSTTYSVPQGGQTPYKKIAWKDIGSHNRAVLVKYSVYSTSLNKYIYKIVSQVELDW